MTKAPIATLAYDPAPYRSGPEVADGWHRYIATQECGRECPAVEYQGDILSLADVAESENRHRRHVPDRYAIGRAVARVRVASAVAGVAGDRLSVGDVADRLGRSQRYYPTALAPLTPNRAGDGVAGRWSPP